MDLAAGAARRAGEDAGLLRMGGGSDNRRLLEGRPASTREEVDDPEGQKGTGPRQNVMKPAWWLRDLCFKEPLGAQVFCRPHGPTFDVGTARQFSHVIALRACQLMRPNLQSQGWGLSP